MASYGNTTKWALRKLLGTSSVREIDDGFASLADDIDPLLTPWSGGTLASRPVSTPGSPGKSGRTYFCTDDNVLYLDYGTGWTAISPKWNKYKEMYLYCSWSSLSGVDRYGMFTGDGGVVNWNGVADKADAFSAFRFDPADLPDGAKVRLRVEMINYHASAAIGGNSSRVEMCPVSSISGGLPVAGASVTGSGLNLLGSVSAGASAKRVGAAVAAPSAGLYVLRGLFMASGFNGAASLLARAALEWHPSPLAT